MSECKWLPKIIPFNNYNNWSTYQDVLYNIFKKDFLDSRPLFESKIVSIRKAPKLGDIEHAFIHLTHKCNSKITTDVNDRLPDLRRSERISWNRKIIENYNCKEICCDCNKILYWEEYYKNNVRVHLLFKDKRFLVVLEKRETYNLLITGYYIEYDNMLKKYINKYNRYSKQKTPLT